MAIRIRRGNLIDFDKNKLVQGELAIVLDKGELHFCYGAGNTKRLATREDLQQMLDMSETSFLALIQSIADLVNDPNELTNILDIISALQANVSSLQANKLDKTSIVNNDTTGGVDKVASAEVVKVHGQEIDTINNNLANISNKFPDNAGAHNSIFRGKNLGSSVTAAQYTAISSGSFEDLYIGDYWTIGGVNYRIAAFNYYYNTGDAMIPPNHITIVPDTSLYDHVMNNTNITYDGYVGSKMYIEGLEQAKTIIRGIFGTHLLKHRQILSNGTADGKASGWVWIDSEVELMSEIMVYGSIAWGESATGGSGYNIGVDKSQLPLFALNPRMINIRQNYWLRDVVSAAHFASVYYFGYASYSSASRALGVRPAFSIS